MTKTIPKKKKCKKAKLLSEEALQIAEKRREAKGKGEKEWKGVDKRFLQVNWRYQWNISCKNGHNKGKKWSGPNRSRRD